MINKFLKIFSVKSFTVLFCLFFIFTQETKAGTITGSTWPTSGAASPSTTGFSAVTGGTHVGSADLPPGSTATGYIAGVDNAALTFKVDNVSVPLQNDNDYWLRFWVRGQRNGTALAADGAVPFYHYLADSSTKLLSQWYLRNNGVSDGFGFTVSEFLPGGSSVGVMGSTISAAQAMLPLNQWGEITIHLHKDGKNGEYAMYLNRSLIRLQKNIPTIQHKATFTVDASGVTSDTITAVGHNMVEGEAITATTTGTLPGGLVAGTTYYVRNPSANTFQLSLTSGGSIIDITSTGTGTHTFDNGGIVLSYLGSQWLMSFNAINGITWQVSGSVSTSSSATIANTPLVDNFVKASDWMTKIYPASYSNLTYGGDFWTQTAGALSVSSSAYCGGGLCPQEQRFVLSGSASSTATLATNIDIGTLPYNSDGWATVFFPMIYLPSSGALDIVVNDTSGNQIYQVNINNGYLKQNGSNQAPWTQSDRYFLALHFSNTGKVNYSMHDLTAGVTTQNFWSGQLADWSPQVIGRVNYVGTRGSADLELGDLVVARWLPLFGLDSLTAGPVTGLTPVLTSVNNVTYSLAKIYESSTIPGSMYSYRSSNLPRFFAWGIIGRQGRTRQNFTDNILPYMNYSKGIVMTFIDGGSINDIAPIGSSESARTTVVNTLISQLSSAISQLISSQNRVWITTMINRVQGSTYTTTQRNAILDYNIGIRNLRQTFLSTYFSDPATDIADPSTLFTAGDDTHFNANGNITYATNMVNDMLSNPPTYSIGGTISGLNGTLVLQNNGGNNLSVSSNNPFTFTTTLNDLASYNVTILTQPANQTCSVSGGSGTVASANVTNVSITCVSTLTTISSFNFANSAVTGAVDNTAHTVTLTVPFGTSVTSLTPTIVLTSGATISPNTGTAQNFTSPVTYTVTAQDGITHQAYIVTVNVALNTDKAITSFNFNGLNPTVSGTIDENGKIISLTVPYGTDVTALVPTIAITGASVSPSSLVAQNFTSPVTYTVTADNASTQNYVVTVSVRADSGVVSHGSGGFITNYYNNLPIIPLKNFISYINQNANTTSNRIVTLNFSAKPDVKKMAISLTGDFTDAKKEPYSPTKQFDLCSKFDGLVKNKTCPNGKYTVYVKFYTDTGVSSQIATSSIMLSNGVNETKNVVLPLVSSSTNNFANKPTETVKYNFNQNLSLHSSGADVKALQQYLNTHGFIISKTGAGSPGNETTLFGIMTYKALVKFQKSIGQSEVGLFGPMTREYINKQ